MNISGLGIFTFSYQKSDRGTWGSKVHRQPVFLLGQDLMRTGIHSPKSPAFG